MTRDRRGRPDRVLVFPLPMLVACAIAALFSLAACAGGASAGWTFVPPQPTASAAIGSPGTSASPGGSPGGSPGASGGAGGVIEVEETADLHIVQNGQPVTQLTVKQGDTLTFKVTNTAGFDHNFYIGPAAKLSINDPTGLTGLPNFASGTQQFTYTVTSDTSNLEFACTLPGHYPQMHGTFTVQP